MYYVQNVSKHVEIHTFSNHDQLFMLKLTLLFIQQLRKNEILMLINLYGLSDFHNIISLCTKECVPREVPRKYNECIQTHSGVKRLRQASVD